MHDSCHGGGGGKSTAAAAAKGGGSKKAPRFSSELAFSKDWGYCTAKEERFFNLLKKGAKDETDPEVSDTCIHVKDDTDFVASLHRIFSSPSYFYVFLLSNRFTCIEIPIYNHLLTLNHIFNRYHHRHCPHRCQPPSNHPLNHLPCYPLTTQPIKGGCC